MIPSTDKRLYRNWTYHRRQSRQDRIFWLWAEGAARQRLRRGWRDKSWGLSSVSPSHHSSTLPKKQSPWEHTALTRLEQKPARGASSLVSWTSWTWMYVRETVIRYLTVTTFTDDCTRLGNCVFSQNAINDAVCRLSKRSGRDWGFLCLCFKHWTTESWILLLLCIQDNSASKANLANPKCTHLAGATLQPRCSSNS